VTPRNSSASVYLYISSDGASFAIYINGAPADILIGSVTNCQYHQIGPLPTGGENNITIVISGPLMSGRQVRSSDWSFELNSFVIGEKASTVSSSSGISGAGNTSSARRNGQGAAMTATAAVLWFAAALFSVLG